MTNLQEWLNEKTDRCLTIRREWLEEMAAAYLLKTDVPPDQVSLVEIHEEDGAITWHFERRAK